MSVALHHRVIGETGSPDLIILHGLLGTSDNWQSLAKLYATSWRVWLVDARNHGQSPHASTHEYADLVADLLAFMDDHGIAEAAILGHSMGGKTALAFALDHPARVSALVIADMAARRYDVHHHAIFEALQSLDVAHAPDRQTIHNQLMERLGDAGFVGFIMKGLVREKAGGFRWRQNLPVLQAALDTIAQAINLSWNTIPTLVIYGGKSSYVKPEDLADFEESFMQLDFHRIEGAGHWLHAESPEEFFQVTFEFLAAA